jgi:hypothetical protein
LDRACFSGLAADKPLCLQGKHHLVYGRGRLFEIALHIGFGGGTAVNFCAVVNKCQVLSLFFGELKHSIIISITAIFIDFFGNDLMIQTECTPPEEDDPWLRYAGLWKDDPDWEVFLIEVEAFRQAIDAQLQLEAP